MKIKFFDGFLALRPLKHSSAMWACVFFSAVLAFYMLYVSFSTLEYQDATHQGKVFSFVLTNLTPFMLTGVMFLHAKRPTRLGWCLFATLFLACLAYAYTDLFLFFNSCVWNENRGEELFACAVGPRIILNLILTLILCFLMWAFRVQDKPDRACL